MKILLLIDAHALIHRAFHALPPLTSPAGEPVQALYGLSSILLKIWRDEKPDYAAALFDRPEPTFREKEYAAYKAQRPKAADELVSQIIKSRELFAKFHIPGYEFPGFEADDLIGTFAEIFGKEKDLKIIILTGDLDALQLVRADKVVVRALKTGISDTVIYNEAAVLTRYGLPPAELTDYKALVGDPSDNIPGLPGVGPKTATALIQKYGSIEKLYKNLDQEPKFKEKYSHNEKEALLFKQLSTIHKNVPLPAIDLKDLTALPPQESLVEYFKDLGFESLVKRLGFSAGEAKDEQIEVKKPAIKKEKLTLFSSTAQADPLFLRDDFEKLQDNELLSSKLKVGFDIKAKIKALKRKGKMLKEPYFDLGIGFWLLDPDAKKYDAASVAKKFLGLDWQGSVEDYASAYQWLENKIKDASLSKIFYGIEMPLVPVLADMELKGIRVDTKILKKLGDDLASEISKLTVEIYKAAGEKININSPKQLATLLFEKLGLGADKIKKTKTGLRSTNVDVLESLLGKHPVVDYLLKYRELFKLQSTYILPTIEHVSHDGRLHTDFVQTGAATGRLSSQNPNLQNIPVSSELAETGENWAKNWAGRFRSAFHAPPGFLLAAFDYSQLELRILASVSGDEKMIETFRSGGDIHRSTAAAIFGVKLEDVTKDMRRVAKTLNFGLIYGMGAEAFSKTASVTREEARTFISNYFKAFPGIQIWHEKIKTEGRKTGYVTNLNSRRRSVLGITYGQSRLASEMERVAINMPIQSLGADIIKLAMIAVVKKITLGELPGKSVAMLLSIHDELLFEIKEGIISDTIERIKKIMESDFVLDMPLTVNVKTGKNWSSLKEI